MITTDKLIELVQSNRLDIFYNSHEWRKLSKEIIREQHNECQLCKAQGKYSRAVLTHHVNPLKLYPSLAYSKYFLDEEGKMQKQLIALCNNCHERIHNRAFQTDENKTFRTLERW